MGDALIKPNSSATVLIATGLVSTHSRYASGGAPTVAARASKKLLAIRSWLV